MNFTFHKPRLSTTTLTGGAIVFAFFLGYYLLLLFGHTSSDIQAHAKIAYSYAVNNDKLFPNFLYFFLVAVLAGFSKNVYAYYAASVILICLALAAKFLITQHYLKKYLNNKNYKPVYYTVLAVMMLFVFALPGVNFFTDRQFYYGTLPPNVWHNSTVIFLMPFSVLLFFVSFELFFSGTVLSKKGLLLVFALVIVNAFIKPSFLFTIIPTVFIFFCWNIFIKKASTAFYTSLVPYIAGLLVIAAEYYLIFNQGHVSSVVNADTASSVAIEPFAVWKNYSPNMLVSFIGSCFFPLIYIVITKGAVLKKRLVQFALVNYTGAMLMWILFAEEGYRKFDANFCWQAIVGAYLLFLSLLISYINDCFTRQVSKKQQYIIGAAFLLHFVWGVIYWLKIIIFKDYV